MIHVCHTSSTVDSTGQNKILTDHSNGRAEREEEGEGEVRTMINSPLFHGIVFHMGKRQSENPENLGQEEEEETTFNSPFLLWSVIYG